MRSAALIGALLSQLLCSSVLGAPTCKVVVRIHANDPLLFNDVAVTNDEDAKRFLQDYKKRNCEVHLVTDKRTGFKAIGRVILLMQQVGYDKVGFLTEPDPVK